MRRTADDAGSRAFRHRLTHREANVVHSGRARNFVMVPRGGLFEGGIGEDRRACGLSPDGKRILGIIAAQTTREALAPTIQVVLNWQEELKRLVPTR